MKKLMIAMVALVALVSLSAMAGDTGTRVGANAVLNDGVTGGIAIGDGAIDSAAIVNAVDAVQIGKGTNSTATTIKFRDKYLVTTTSATPALSSQAISAAQLTAGTVATAINGAAITNISADNVSAGNLGIARLPTLGITTNFTFLSASLTTGRVYFAYGIITNVVQSGQ